jgi:hypothetical protein
MKREPIDIRQASRHLGTLGERAFRALLGLGLLGLAVSVVLGALAGDGFGRCLEAWLVSFAFWLSLSLGALFFVVLQHLTGATWSVVVRRPAEALAANLPWLALAALPLVLGMRHLYLWSDPARAAGDALIQAKAGYLNPVFFTLRLALYFGVWSWLARYYFRRSVEQDTSGDPALTHRMQRWSAPAVLAFALTATFAAFDLLMSLDPHWFSTIFGVYFFAGSFLGFVALLTLVLHLLQGTGRLTGVVTREHYHDLGKLIFAFTIFWAYIAFSQYMLYWYGNLPEETGWYLRRQTGDWTGLGVLLIFGHFFLPFLGLLARYPKRQKFMLLPGTLWVLAMHYADLYWLVMPEFSPGRLPLHVLDLSAFLGLGALLLALTVRRLQARSLVPERDPRLADSLIFENA